MKLFIFGAIIVGTSVSVANVGAQAASSRSVLEPTPPPLPAGTRIAPLSFRPGTAIRVRTSTGTVEGTLATSSRDSVYVRTPDRDGVTAIPTTVIGGIDVQYDGSERRGRVFRGIGIGAGIGGALGTAVGMSIPVKDDCPNNNCIVDLSGLEQIANTFAGAVVGMVGGAIIGGAIANTRSSGWQPVHLIRVAAGPTWRLGKPVGVVAALRLPFPRP